MRFTRRGYPTAGRSFFQRRQACGVWQSLATTSRRACLSSARTARCRLCRVPWPGGRLVSSMFGASTIPTSGASRFLLERRLHHHYRERSSRRREANGFPNSLLTGTAWRLHPIAREKAPSGWLTLMDPIPSSSLPWAPLRQAAPGGLQMANGLCSTRIRSGRATSMS